MEISLLKDLSNSFNATSFGSSFHSCMVLGKKEILIKITLCISSHICMPRGTRRGIGNWVEISIIYSCKIH